MLPSSNEPTKSQLTPETCSCCMRQRTKHLKFCCTYNTWLHPIVEIIKFEDLGHRPKSGMRDKGWGNESFFSEFWFQPTQMRNHMVLIELRLYHAKQE